MNLCNVQRIRSFRGRAAIRDLNEDSSPSVQMVERVAVFPLNEGNVGASAPIEDEKISYARMRFSYSANAVYICLYKAWAVGPTRRKPIFGRGLVLLINL